MKTKRNLTIYFVSTFAINKSKIAKNDDVLLVTMRPLSVFLHHTRKGSDFIVIVFTKRKERRGNILPDKQI